MHFDLKRKGKCLFFKSLFLVGVFMGQPAARAHSTHKGRRSFNNQLVAATRFEKPGEKGKGLSTLLVFFSFLSLLLGPERGQLKGGEKKRNNEKRRTKKSCSSEIGGRLKALSNRPSSSSPGGGAGPEPGERGNGRV